VNLHQFWIRGIFINFGFEVSNTSFVAHSLQDTHKLSEQQAKVTSEKMMKGNSNLSRRGAEIRAAVGKNIDIFLADSVHHRECVPPLNTWSVDVFLKSYVIPSMP
jgi:hypothetical protein